MGWGPTDRTDPRETQRRRAHRGAYEYARQPPARSSRPPRTVAHIGGPGTSVRFAGITLPIRVRRGQSSTIWQQLWNIALHF